MALIVEDGTGKLDAESYISVADFKTYCDKRGLTYGNDASIEINLRKATDYMISVFRGSWKGVRTVHNQALDWPRWGVARDAYDLIGINTLPPEVLACCSELAVVASTTSLLPTSITRGKKSVKIGPLAIEYDGEGDSAPAFVNGVRRLAPLLTAAASGNTVGLVRS